MKIFFFFFFTKLPNEKKNKRRTKTRINMNKKMTSFFEAKIFRKKVHFLRYNKYSLLYI